MFGQEISTFSFWCVALMICIILLVVLGQVSRFYAKMRDYCKDTDAQQLALNAQLKQLQGTLSEILGELRRSNRLVNEQLELKRAEMTGDFEIVEEPIVPPPVAAKVQEAPQGSAAPKAEPPKTFPKI
ncbi:MAG: hypothetical protein E7048_10565 [Lentisphaerae bacterium]|nr:hypothetical protein [Lentisphaerota bacterium]